MNPAYVLVRSDELRPGPELVEYLRSVDDSLEQHGAKILVQSFPAEVPLGTWDGFITLLQFPSLEQAQRWYESPEYSAIRHLRVASSVPTDVIVPGVSSGHRSEHLLASLRG